jgi:hypothetical protein
VYIDYKDALDAWKSKVDGGPQRDADVQAAWHKADTDLKAALDVYFKRKK